MSTMRAYTHTARGPPSLTLNPTTLPNPTLSSPTQLLVRTTHCALNPGASIVMQLLPFIFRARPAVPEMDFAGTVECTGSSVTDMPPGTPVFGSIPVGQHVRSTSGALAGSIVVERDAVVRVPGTVALSEAAGVGIAGSTALACVTAAKVKRGDAVLVNGAAGGIGHLVLQMCLEKVGASGRVVGVCSGRNTSWVRELERGSSTDNAVGSLRVIDREAEPLVPRLVRDYGAERFDVVIDAAGIQEVYQSCPGFLKEGKPYVTVGPRLGRYTYAGMLGMLGTTAKNVLWPRILGGTPRPYVQVAAAASLETLEELAGMMERGALRVHVGTLVDWEDVMKAYEKLLSGHASGKVVVAIGEQNTSPDA